MPVDVADTVNVALFPEQTVLLFTVAAVMEFTLKVPVVDVNEPQPVGVIKHSY